MKKVLTLLVFLIFAASVRAQTNAPNAVFDLTDYGVRIEPDRRVMVVMASLEAAGLDTPLTADGEQFRGELKTDLQSVTSELRRKLVTFVEQYKRRHPLATNTEIVSPFISMAYTLSPAPDFSDPLRETDLPGDLLEVLDFAPLVRELYRRNLSANLDKYVKEYQAAGDAMRPTTVTLVADLLDYLHTRPDLTYIDRVKTQVKAAKGKKNLEQTKLRERTRRFFVVPELLAPKETVNFRNIGDDYYAVVPPSADLSRSEVRRAFLQFVIDPLILKNGKEISTARDGIKTLLDARREANPDVSPDVFLAVSRSLVAAVDARQIEFQKTRIATVQARRKIDRMKTEKEKLAVSAELNAFKKSIADETAAQLSDAYEKGAVLAFYFADQLKGSEDSGFDISASLRDYILALDAAKETNRLAQNADARQSALAARDERRKNAGSREIVIDNPITQKLLAIDELAKSKKYLEAEKQLTKLAVENPTEARVYYALGRIASLSAEGVTDEDERDKRLLAAKNDYEKAILTTKQYPDKITKQPDVALMSLAYVALARLYEFAGDTSYAIKIYEAALAVGNVPEGAYQEAFAARSRLLKDQ